MATTLMLEHVSGTPPVFVVRRLNDGKGSKPVQVPSPFGFPVEGRPDSDLVQELSWYLEAFLDWPFEPETDHADRVQRALKDWGRQAFEGLFSSLDSGRLFHAATAADYSQLTLLIASDEAQVLTWPWEALRDPMLGSLAHTCQIERRLSQVLDPPPVPTQLPRDRVNILLVVARPNSRDVGFRSIARPLVELIEKEELPAQVELLRPPTFDRLRRHLKERPGYYHILHFDGHGTYGALVSTTEGASRPAEGRLLFEKEDGSADPVSAGQLSELLRDYSLPGVVLNACQSGMVDSQAEDPFASVAAALLRAGMRSVVAMSYSLRVSGAQQFLPAFYRSLFERGSIAEAVRAGRQQMRAQPERICARGTFPLDDWLVPVLYQQAPLDFHFAAEARNVVASRRESKLPPEVREAKMPHGFVGRDGPLLELERAMRRPPAGIVVQGLGGVGKTAFIRSCLQWLDATGGLGEGCSWFGFQDIHSAEYVFNRVGEQLFSTEFLALPVESKIQALAERLRRHKLVLVWDNFESATGIANSALAANLSETERSLLRQFLNELRGGVTKVLITSRSTEDWLGFENRYLLSLGGLAGEERWEYCEILLSDLGLQVDRTDKILVELINLLGGHPLAMRAVLPKLERQSPTEILRFFQQNVGALGGDADETQVRLNATLRFVEQDLSERLKPFLLPLSLYQGFAALNKLQAMAADVEKGNSSSANLSSLLAALGAAGLLREVKPGLFEMHPVLTGYLRATVLENATRDTRDSWGRAFAVVMTKLGDQLAPLHEHEQREQFLLDGENLRFALREATRLGMTSSAVHLIQALCSIMKNRRDFSGALSLSAAMVETAKASDNRHYLASAYEQIGSVAIEQRDFRNADRYLRESARIWHDLNDRPNLAVNYHQLGYCSFEGADYVAAEQWYRWSLDAEDVSDSRGAAFTYHELGRVEQQRGNLDKAREWYLRSAAIREKNDDRYDAATNYHQLGYVAQEQGDLGGAEKWFRKSLAITEKLGDGIRAGMTYHHLGMIEQRRGNFGEAGKWYLKSSSILEQSNDLYHAAISYHGLGSLAFDQQQYVDAGGWFLKGMTVTASIGAEDFVKQTASDLGLTYRSASALDKQKLRQMYADAGLQQFASALAAKEGGQ